MNQNLYSDPRTRQFLLPVHIVWQSDGDAAPEASDALLVNNTGQCRFGSIAVCRIRHAGGILLDFGRELHGGIQLVTAHTEDKRPVRVRVRFGESVSEAMSEPVNDHSMHDEVCYLPWCGSQEIGNTGFRFVRIDALDADRELALIAVRAVSLMRDLPYRGRFTCDDERLNRIWQTGAYTTHLCLQEYVWDGIKRDRLVWIGDMHPITMVATTVFGDVSVVRDSLDFVRDNTPLPGWMNGISSYSIWWMLIQTNWYLYHGNLAYLAEQQTYLTSLLRQLLACVDEQGSEKLADWRFLDWPSSENPEAIHVGLHALLSIALAAGADLCATLKEEELRQQCLGAVQLLSNHRPELRRESKQASSLLALAGLVDPAVANAQVLACDPYHGVSTFFGYYILQARALAGDYAGALDLIRRYWGGMLDMGATTFWEDFDVSWMENAARIDELVPPGKKD
ncbi:MAG TPA: alpha-L-rhamnosidase, partial [Armatimonadota bacterium]|nr:alpha-L-rhamnosidase [Armatimonadota bacterium]